MCFAGFGGKSGSDSLLQCRQFVFDDLMGNLKCRINELAKYVFESFALLTPHYT